jgi:hypothetical protein
MAELGAKGRQAAAGDVVLSIDEHAASAGAYTRWVSETEDENEEAERASIIIVSDFV